MYLGITRGVGVVALTALIACAVDDRDAQVAMGPLEPEGQGGQPLDDGPRLPGDEPGSGAALGAEGSAAAPGASCTPCLARRAARRCAPARCSRPAPGRACWLDFRVRTLPIGSVARSVRWVTSMATALATTCSARSR